MYYSIQFVPASVENVTTTWIPPADSSDEYLAQNWHMWFNAGRNTWNTWHLIPTERPSIVPPTVLENYVDIPGAKVPAVDLTEVLTGKPLYGYREGSWEFYVVPNYIPNPTGELPDIWDGSFNFDDWSTLYQDILGYLHGKKMKVYLESMGFNGGYYLGRIKVNKWQSEKDWSKIQLDYKLEPFMYDNFTNEIITDSRFYM